MKCIVCSCNVSTESGRAKKYCSWNCQREYYKNKLKLKHICLPCNVCGSMVVQTQKGVKYCSRECRLVGSKKTSINTNLKLHGVEYVGQRTDVKLKSKRTNMMRHGVECVFSLESVKKKIKNTINEKYEVDHPMHCPRIKQKMIETNKKNHDGVHNTKQHYITGVDGILADINMLREMNLQYSIKEIANELSVAESTIRKVFYNNGVDIKHHRISNFEKEVRREIQYIGTPIYNSRKLIKPYELDIFFPEYRVAIECNSRYFHQDSNRENIKSELCKHNNIVLFIIWDDVWDIDKKLAMREITEYFASFLKK